MCAMNRSSLHAIQAAGISGRPISCATALAILGASAGDMPDIMAAANRVRRRYFGDTLHNCSIINAKSGACGEDCAFCAQSAHHRTTAEVYALKKSPAIVAARNAAAGWPVNRFGIVTSGASLSRPDLARIIALVRQHRAGHPAWCGSLGDLGIADLKALKTAGLKRYHHNIETAPSFFAKICSTHSFDERIATIRRAKMAGLQVCCGGILGMGETNRERVVMALTLAREKVDSIPLNFLVAVPGTRMAGSPPLEPLMILKIIAMFRLTNPKVEIKVAAGRMHLRDLQSMIFFAGATGIMIGNLLTVAGRDVNQDIRMLKDLGFSAVCT